MRTSPRSRAPGWSAEDAAFWRAVLLMLLARPVLAVPAQAVAAGVLALGGTPDAWQSAGVWLPVYGTLIDAGCLVLLLRLLPREGLRLGDLIDFRRDRFLKDVGLALLLIPLSLVFIFAGTAGAGWLVYGSVSAPYFGEPLPLWAALYGTLIWPVIWGLTEQLTYNGYVVRRLQTRWHSPVRIMLVVSVVWAFQHTLMPLTADPAFIAFRGLSALPHSIFEVAVFLRLRRILPLAIAHALMDASTVVIGSLVPLWSS